VIRKIALILAFATSVSAAGIATFFRHVDSRMRKLAPNVSVLVTGESTGLMLQCPQRGDVKFLRKESFVIQPGGGKLPLLFMRMDDGFPNLKGFWRAITSAPLLLVNGIYKYHIVVIIDGVRFEFDHSIEIHTQPSHEHTREEVQLDTKPRDY